MTTREEALGLFNAGRLDDAVAAAATAAVKQSADTPGPRLLLAELLLFTGAFERVETLLAAAVGLSPDLAVVVAEFRQLLRAAARREQLATEGAVPSFLGEPTATQAEALRGMVAWRAGDHAAAAVAADALEAMRPRAPGHAESGDLPGADTGDAAIAFDDLRDVDDLLAGSVEVLTTTGTYYWIPTERIELIEFHPPQRPRDLLWRRCTMSVAQGPEGDVYIPATYRAAPDASAAIRLGRATDWSDAAPVRGHGQRVFLAGDEALPIMAIRRLRFGAAAAG